MLGMLPVSTGGGGSDLPTQTPILKFLKILPYKHILKYIDFSFLSIAVLQKNTEFSMRLSLILVAHVRIKSFFPNSKI